MTKSCATCRKPFDAKTSKAKFCSSTCRVRAHRSSKVLELRPATPAPTADGAAGVAASTRAALEAADRLETPAGAAALVLAGRLDLGEDSGSAMAALTRELRATIAEALDGAHRQRDEVDELRERRLRRVGG